MTEEEFRKLTRKVDLLASAVTDRASVLDLRALQQEAQRARRLTDEVQQELADLQKRVSAVADLQFAEADERRAGDRRQAATTAELARQVDGLARRVRAQAGDDLVVVDDRAGLADLARRAARGADLRAGHLTDDEQAGLVRRRDDWAAWHDRRRRDRDEIVATSATIAAGDGSDAGAAARFRQLRRSLAELEATRDATRDGAQEAATRLAADEALRERDAAVVDDSNRASDLLRAALRTRISGALARGAVLPIWFDRSLGLSPHGDADGWLRTAVSLTAYRVTFAVDDPVVALGPAPDEAWSPPRSRWYRQLRTELRQDGERADPSRP